MAGEPPTKRGAVKAPAPKVFNCPSCGSGVLIRAQGLSVSVACRACGSVIDTANENYQVISKAAQNLKIEPLIPLGQRGKLHGTTWEVIGYMKRSDGSGAYTWSEYLLFNPTKKFHWLTEFDGHWNYVVMTHDRPSDMGDQVHLLGKNYNRFHEGVAKVLYVVGEFYWRVAVGDKVLVSDYINPPEILSKEKDGSEITWSLGEYIEADTVRRAFQISKPMPAQTGVAPNQPSTVSSLAPTIGKYWGFFLSVIIAIQFLLMISAGNEQAYRSDFVWRLNDTEKLKVTPQFELKHGLTNVDFKLYSPVQNNWMEVEVDLVNDQTGKTYEFEQGVEYYSGFDIDGSWTEGSQTSHVTLSSIPAGLYHLNIQASGPASNPWSTGAQPTELTYSVTVTRDVITWSNFFWAIALISIFPALMWWRSRSFEQARWSTSDFSPYWSHQEEE
jgi:hypothetical protein